MGNDFIVESSVGHIRDLPKKSSPTSKRASIPKDVSPEEKIRLKALILKEHLIVNFQNAHGCLKELAMMSLLVILV